MKKFVSICLLGLFVCGSVFSDTHYVDRNNPTPVEPYLSWETAATEIQQAVDSASSGDTVWVTNGVYDTGGAITPSYSCANRVVITNDITLQSVNGADVTLIQGSEATGGGNGADAVRGVYMSTGRLSGFTITNGHTQASGNSHFDGSGGGVNMYGGDGIVSNCTLTGNSAEEYGGGSCCGTLNNCTLKSNSTSGGGSYYDTLNNCTLTGNSAGFGGGSYRGTLNNCTLKSNSASDGGGGSRAGTLNNCTLTGNSANFGGGSRSCTLNNCTLTGNSANGYGGRSSSGGGGSSGDILNNCIIYHNTAAFNGANWVDGTFSNSCTFPLPSGTGNITNNPMLVSSSHVAFDSPCVGAGSATFTWGTDIDGDAWQSPPSMGCDEPLSFLTGPLQVSISVSETNMVVGHSLSFFANIVGEVSSNRWSWGDGVSQSNDVCLQHAWSTPGVYDVVVTAYNDDFLSGVSVTQAIHVFSVDDAAIYVSATTGDDAQDGKRWTTAKRTLQAGVDAAGYAGCAGATVWATNGVYDIGGKITPGYSCANRVIITNDIILQSVNGVDVTFIQGSEASGGGNGPDAVRGVYMSAGVLSGFTVTNGHTQTSGDYGYDKSGGGVNMYDGDGVVTNCVLTGNSTGWDGGGSYCGTLNNCTLTGNSAKFGGGSHYGTLNDCTLTGNSGKYGGGSVLGTLNNCILTGNSSSDGAGGSSGCTLNNCTLTDNTANRGGGSGGGTLNNCTLIGNSANYGGGSYEGTLNNCTLTSNTANYGGGSRKCTLNNCTLTGNSAIYGGGSYNGMLNNCVLTDNTADYDGGGSYYGTLNNCVLMDNTADDDGGGSCDGTLNNCTLTGNSAADDGGGSYNGTLSNCIVYHNTAADSGENWENGTFSYSCTTPAVSGTGNITDSPLFVDRASGNFRLLSNSPCINSGDNGSAPSGTDLDGNPRIMGGTVDMGAFEVLFDDLMLSPNEGLVSSVYESGPFSPSSKVYALSNTGGSNLSWSARWSQSWVDVLPASGTLPAGESTNVIVSFTSEVESLPLGTYSDVIVFSNQISGATQSRDIVLGKIASESFESGMGSWVDSSGYDFNWTRRSGSTTSSGTGPSGAEDGTYYIYTESSSPNYPSKTAAVEASVDFSGISAPTLSFDYHMYGAAMGTLYVDVFDGAWHTGVWSVAGQQQTGDGDAWEQVTVNLASYGNKSVVKIRFRGVTGSSYTSDMALDNVVLRGVQSTTDPDADGDGLPDWWEEQHFSGATNANPNTLCSNGLNTVREAYIAGLDPTNATSRLMLNPVSGNALNWSAISGRVYSIWWTTNLLENFQPLETNLLWPQDGYTNPNPNPCDYYKIKVELE